jgi:hypothetical protein
MPIRTSTPSEPGPELARAANVPQDQLRSPEAPHDVDCECDDCDCPVCGPGCC